MNRDESPETTTPHPEICLLRQRIAELEAMNVALRDKLQQMHTNPLLGDEPTPLEHIAAALNQTISPSEALQAGLNAVAEQFQAEQGWLWFVSTTEKVQCIAMYNPPTAIRTAPPADTTTDSLLCTCLNKLFHGDMAAPAEILVCQRLLAENDPLDERVRHISIPITTDNKPIGVLNLVIPSERAMESGDMRLLAAIRNQFGVAMERARLFEQITEALMHLQRLNEVTRTISSALDLPTVLRTILRLSIELVGADAGSMGLLTPDTDRLTFHHFGHTTAFDNVLTVSTTLPNIQQIVHHVIEVVTSIIIADYPSAPTADPKLIASGLRGLLAVPIVTKERALGVLILFTLNPDKLFTERDRVLAETVGRQAGVAIAHARLFAEVQYLATTDSLTGLANRRNFFDLATREHRRSVRYGCPLAILMIDIDHFKAVNDRYGHVNGDRVLHHVASQCRTLLREVDLIGRYGGEEFVALLPQTDAQCASIAAERLRQQIAQTPMLINDESLPITVSVGVAAFDGTHELDLEQILDYADQALYWAKACGRNRVICWGEHLPTTSPLIRD